MTRLEACIEHHLERVRLHTTARPRAIDDASARRDPVTRPFAAIATAPEPRRTSSVSGVRTSPRATALMPAVAG